jgi:quinol monooxygenase YgiN
MKGFLHSYSVHKLRTTLIIYIRVLYALKCKINLHRLRSSEGTLASVCVYEPETIKLNIRCKYTDHYFIEQYNRQRALQKHLCHCLLASWNLDQNLGETYEYVLEIADRPSRLGFPEGTLTYVCVYDHETIKLNTDHYFIEQYNRQRALQKHLCHCLLAS